MNKNYYRSPSTEKKQHLLKKHTKSQVYIIIQPSNTKAAVVFYSGAEWGSSGICSPDVISIVVIYNVLSHHAEILTPPKLTPDSEAICPATERLSRTTGQWDGSCLTQCFPQPTLFARNTHSQRFRGKARFWFPRMTLFPESQSSTHRPAE